MRTYLPPYWTVSDLTGNSTFVQTEKYGTLAVTNCDASGVFQILVSTDDGVTFTQAASATITGNRLDPSIYYEEGIPEIHIVGHQTDVNSGLIDIIYLKASISTTAPYVITLSAPVILAETQIASPYDIIRFSGTNYIIVTTLTNSPSIAETNGQYLVELGIDSSTFSPSPPVVLSQISNPLPNGTTYGGVSLVRNNSTTPSQIELYYSSHSTQLNFNPVPPITHTIYQNIRGISGVWGNSKLLYSFTALYTSVKLTVIPFTSGASTQMLLTTFYYIDSKLTSLVAYATYDGNNWDSRLTEVADNGYAPTPSVSSLGGFRIGYLVRLSSPSSDGYLKIINVGIGSTGSYTPDTTAWPNQNGNVFYTYLRGSKSPILNSDWAMLGIHDSTTKTSDNYLSGLPTIPVVFLSSSPSSLKRMDEVTISSSTTTDPDGYKLSYEWSLSPSNLPGVTFLSSPTSSSATLLVDNSFGPSAQTFTITLIVKSSNGNSSSPATISLQLPADSPPTISWASPTLSEDRALSVSTNLTWGDLENPTPTVGVTQISGGPVLFNLNELNGVFTFSTSGVNLFGDTLIFRASVNDGVNVPVTADLTVTVASRLTTTNPSMIYRISQGNEIGSSNTSSWPTWSSLIPALSALSSDFTSEKTISTLSGATRRVYISPDSVLVVGCGEVLDTTKGYGPYNIYYSRRYTPSSSTTISDAHQTENDQTYILGSNNILYLYSSLGVGGSGNTLGFNCSDNPKAQFDLSIYGATFTSMIANRVTSSNQSRVIALSGTGGLLLLEVNESSVLPPSASMAPQLGVTHHIMMTVENNMLSGGNSIVFVRMSGVASIRVGKILVGSKDAQGNFFEMVYDLGLQRTVSSWGPYTQYSKDIVTGEIL